MLKRYTPFILLVSLMVACSKDKMDTRPSIKLKSVSATEVPNNVPIQIVLEYTDKEGDLGTGTISYLRNRLNVLYPVINDLADSVGYTLPNFPKTSKGEIELIIPAGFLDENPNEIDTVQFRIYVKDVAGNVSDTLDTPVFYDITP